ncbi:MAG: YncE family protein [Actinobacteria bacterium]|nr:YncE family protein [Actinomycetota bacterium]
MTTSQNRARRRLIGSVFAVLCSVVTVTACSPAAHKGSDRDPMSGMDMSTSSSRASSDVPQPPPSVEPSPEATAFGPLLPGMPPPLSATDVYAADKPGMLSETVAGDRALVYVPNDNSNSVTIIDQATMTVLGTYPAGHEPQHVVPSYDLKTLYVVADQSPGDGLTPIDPKTGTVGKLIPVTDPYNLYFTPDGEYAIVVAEAFKRLDFYDPHTWKLHDSLPVPSCAGIDHIDFTADGRTLLASCEFANRLAVVDVASHTLLRTINLTQVAGGMPQDVKLAPDGSVFYVADMKANGVHVIDGSATKVIGFIPTGKETHGLYIDRTSTRMFITNRGEGSISVLDLATRRVATKWMIPGGGSPDMGNLSADGKVFWVSGRYNACVYAIDTTDGHLIKKLSVGSGPHGLTVWPQPGRYSLGHTGILR